jgi:hypothetical protein
MGGGGNLPVGPGIWGFIAFFVLAIALWLLVRNMNARLRRMAYSDRERSEAAEAAAREAEGDGASTSPPETGNEGPGATPEPRDDH